MTAPADGPLQWIDAALVDLERDDLRRTLRHHDGPTGPWLEVESDDKVRRLLHLCGNGYLGLASHPEVVAAAVAAVERFGAGSGASRLVTGGQGPHAELERDLASWLGHEDAVLFSSGYLANLGVVSSLVGPGDTVVSDERNHASLIDACRLSRADVRIYRHGDAEHAAALLADASGRRLLVTDGVFSMDGDVAPLPALCDAAEAHGAIVVVDDAHATGLLGRDGRGSPDLTDTADRVHITVSTLSKSLASSGGFVVADRQVCEWIRNRARPFIFDTAPPAAAVAAASAALGVARREPERAARALSNSRRLAHGLRAAGFDIAMPAACIIPIVIGQNAQALMAMERLLEHDVLAVAIRPPAVPAGTARIRVTVMATHSDDDLSRAIVAFADVRAHVT